MYLSIFLFGAFEILLKLSIHLYELMNHASFDQTQRENTIDSDSCRLNNLASVFQKVLEDCGRQFPKSIAPIINNIQAECQETVKH